LVSAGELPQSRLFAQESVIVFITMLSTAALARDECKQNQPVQLSVKDDGYDIDKTAMIKISGR
jgi:hypothetical protein